MGFVGAILALISTVAPASAAYKVQQGDTIEITVVGIPELSQRNTVQPDGAIALPLVGALSVEGLTPSELREKVQSQFEQKIYRLRASDGHEILTVIRPEEVSAAIVGYRPIYVTGDVAKQGQQTFLPAMTVRQALALAGGFDFQGREQGTVKDLPTLRIDYELALSDIASATVQTARLNAELNGRTEFGPIDFSDTPLSRDRLTEIQKSEAAILQAQMDDYQRQHDFFNSAMGQADERISVVAQQKNEEEAGNSADTTELHRLLDLLSKGQETSLRVTEARRALLLSSTRTLQANVELLELKRQKSDLARQAQHFEDQRRIDLLKALQEAAAAQAAAKIKAQKLALELNSSRRLDSLLDLAANVEHNIEVVRQEGGQAALTVDEDFVLMPGDVINVTLRPPLLTSTTENP
ncbi:exopolysaccharide biosynthesis protein [Labrys miyagiensis]|uniref:Exopolysaccharide biosynthesis protein n=2 Tax=Labrys miyagiensis TaxID=346912 RepID=A0ABQ6CSN4_9HYPH|nr:exopolysaccharide biosynthesis protein [Labrys miyagiensis]